MERADHATLEDRPEAFNRVRMDRANHVLVAAMIDAAVRDAGGQILIAGPSIRRQQANFVGANLVDECDCGLRRHALQRA